MAMRICCPGVRDDVVKIATPPAVTVPVPSSVDPSIKFTVPVGVDPLPVICAVRVIELPTVAALTVEERVVAVPTVCTVWTSTGVTLAWFRLSPE
jgi:hypothetical protein